MLSGADVKDAAPEGRKKRRKYKSSAPNQYGFIIKISLGAIIIQGFFIFNYLMGKTLM